MKKRMRTIVTARRGAHDPYHCTPSDRELLASPFSVGGLEIPNRVVMAPLAGIGNRVFRVQAHQHGAGLVVSEMVASMGLRHGNQRTRDMIALDPAERITAIQLFGADPSAMAEAAVLVEEAGASAVDINMGCPVPKICKTGSGAALLDDPDNACAVVRAMSDAVSIPVTVKMRRGVTPARSQPTETAQRLVDAGAAALTVHPRAAAEEYAGTADHAITAEVVRKVDVPVIASGDITSVAQAAQVLRDTGCAAVMIGRAALGDPWVLGAMSGSPVVRPDREGVIAELVDFAEQIRELMGDYRACHYMRKFYAWYLAGEDVSSELLNSLQLDETLDAALERLRIETSSSLKHLAV